MWSHSRTCVPKQFISLVHPCLIYLFKIYLASSTYHELRFLRRGVWAWEPSWCSALFYLALQHKTCLHIDARVYLLKFRWEFVSTSAARGFPLSGRSWKERGKNSRRRFVSISVEETTPYFPQAMGGLQSCLSFQKASGHSEKQANGHILPGNSHWDSLPSCVTARRPWSTRWERPAFQFIFLTVCTSAEMTF